MELIWAVWWRGPWEWPHWWHGALLPTVEDMELNCGTGKTLVRILCDCIHVYVHVHIGSYMCTCMHTLLVHLHPYSSWAILPCICDQFSLCLSLSLSPSLPYPLSFSVNLSLLVQLDVGSVVRLPATASLVWPSLVLSNSSSSVVEFPTTTIGNSSVRHTY